MHLQALILDFDGVIVDTESPFLASWVEVYEAHGLQFPFASWYARLAGDPLAFDPTAFLTSRATLSCGLTEIEDRRWRRYNELLLQQSVRPGVTRLLTSAASAGVRLGIASGADRARMDATLTRLGLRDVFSSVVSGDDVPRRKPFPDVYLHALRCLETKAECAVAIEDSLTGVVAARRAGLVCVAVPNDVTCNVSLEMADRVCTTLAEVDVAELDALLQRSAVLLTSRTATQVD